MKRPIGLAVLSPGFGGSAESPLLRRLAKALAEIDILSAGVTWSPGRPSPDYQSELALLAKARSKLLGRRKAPLVLVGRSFGGRISAFLATTEPPAALVVLGHPIRPPGRRRILDEQALLALRCPTLIVQGQRDELGPLRVLRPLVRKNPNIELEVLPGVGHSFGAQERQAVTLTTAWVRERLLGGA